MVTRFAEDEAERPFPADHHTLRGSSPDRRDRLGRSPNIVAAMVRTAAGLVQMVNEVKLLLASEPSETS
jgi:hypothetical protein